MPFFCDLDPMSLILKLDLDMVIMYLCTENEIPSFCGSKVRAQAIRQTNTHTHTDPTEIITYLHTWMVIKWSENISFWDRVIFYPCHNLSAVFLFRDTVWHSGSNATFINNIRSASIGNKHPHSTNVSDIFEKVSIASTSCVIEPYPTFTSLRISLSPFLDTNVTILSWTQELVVMLNIFISFHFIFEGTPVRRINVHC